jgi:hypothetical protein
MKVRRIRKRAHERLMYNRGWDWWFDSFIRRSVACFNSLPKAMQEAFHERQLQQE